MALYRVAPPQVLPAGYVVVPLSGEIDLAATEEVAAALADAGRRARTGVVVDLSRLTFIDASGLGVLIRAHLLSSHLPAGLRVAAAPAQAARLLRMTHLDSYLAVFPTVCAATSNSG